tara:strand:+ start:501 stop:722 length:222 start_codon:yes stop_codon:yes gene_type:complete
MITSTLFKQKKLGITGEMLGYINSNSSVTFELWCLQCGEAWRVTGPYTEKFLEELKLRGKEFAEHELACLEDK